jgi:hypothetical protein
MNARDEELRAAQLALDEAFDALRKFEQDRTGVAAKPPLCSFCRHGINQVKRMLGGGHDTHICDQCIKLCYEIVFEGRVVGPWDRG